MFKRWSNFLISRNIIAPEDAASEHLALLAAAAEVFSDDALREKLLTASSADTFCGALRSWCSVQPSDKV